MQTTQALTAARKLIEDPEFWWRGEYAADNLGIACMPDDPDAYCFCALGAVHKVCGDISEDGDIRGSDASNGAISFLSEAAEKLFGRGEVGAVNDGEIGVPDTVDDLAFERTLAHRNVLEMFDLAIQLAEGTR